MNFIKKQNTNTKSTWLLCNYIVYIHYSLLCKTVESLNVFLRFSQNIFFLITYIVLHIKCGSCIKFCVCVYPPQVCSLILCSCLKVREIYLKKYHALIGWPDCIKPHQVEGIHFDTKWKDVSTDSNNARVEGQTCISLCVFGVSEMLQKRP